MIQVERHQYSQIDPLFAKSARIHLHITAILQGDSRGKVFVDDVVDPQTAYIDAGEAHYLAGDPNKQSFNKALNAHLPRDTFFVLFCDPDLWAGSLDVILENTYAVRAPRDYYELKALKIAAWSDRIPDGFAVQPISPELLDKGLNNGDAITEAIVSEWFSLDAFIEGGFGFCLTNDSAIVSWSLVDYVSGPRCEIGINTDWDYRRRGFGTLTTAANAAQALEQGFSSIGWHCWSNNVGSIGVAENVGFVKTAVYDIFISHWAAENVSDMSQEEFKAFAESYKREFEVNPPANGFPHIVTAKAWALAQNQEGAFTHLHKAVDLGWLRDLDHLREIWPELFWNPDLDEMKEWQDFIKRLDTA